MSSGPGPSASGRGRHAAAARRDVPAAAIARPAGSTDQGPPRAFGRCAAGPRSRSATISCRSTRNDACHTRVIPVGRTQRDPRAQLPRLALAQSTISNSAPAHKTTWFRRCPDAVAALQESVGRRMALRQEPRTRTRTFPPQTRSSRAPVQRTDTASARDGCLMLLLHPLRHEHIRLLPPGAPRLDAKTSRLPSGENIGEPSKVSLKVTRSRGVLKVPYAHRSDDRACSSVLASARIIRCGLCGRSIRSPMPLL